jgi:hypothetical protein
LRFERRFLKPILAALRNLRYTAIVPRDKDRILVQGNDEQMKREAATLSPEQMWGLKAMIIGDIPATSLDADQINALVRWVDEGGSLLFLAGPQSMGQSGFGATPLADLLPVSVGANAAYIEGEIRVRLTPLGAAHPAFQRVQSQWDRAAPLLSRFNVQSVLPAATVLFSTASEPAAPIVVSRRYGHGKVTIVLTDSTWRWQLAHGTGERGRSARGEHALFWEQLIDWLLPDLSEDAPDEHQVQLITDRLTYEINDVVTLMAGVQSADGSVVPDARVLFSIAAANGRTIKRSGILQEQAGQIAETVYVAEFDVLAEGSYEIRVMATHQGKILGTDQTTICVIHPLIEFANTDPDHELLNELADLSEGQVLDPQDLANLSDIISLSPREVWVQPHAEADAEPVWDRWWILTVFIALMTTEWTVRRMNQWV